MIKTSTIAGALLSVGLGLASVASYAVTWTNDTSNNVPVKDLDGCGTAPTPSTSTSSSFTFGLTCTTKSSSTNRQRGEWKYERRSGYHKMIANFKIATTYKNFDKVSIAQTHDDSTGSAGVFTIYQVRKNASGWEFGVQGDTFGYRKIANISLGVTYKLDIATNSSGSASETAKLFDSTGTQLGTTFSTSGGGESTQYKKIGAYALTDGYGPISITFSNVNFYTGR